MTTNLSSRAEVVGRWWTWRTCSLCRMRDVQRVPRRTFPAAGPYQTMAAKTTVVRAPRIMASAEDYGRVAFLCRNSVSRAFGLEHAYSRKMVFLSLHASSDQARLASSRGFSGWTVNQQANVCQRGFSCNTAGPSRFVHPACCHRWMGTGVFCAGAESTCFKQLGRLLRGSKLAGHLGRRLFSAARSIASGPARGLASLARPIRPSLDGGHT